MTNSKTTKRALFSSVVALLLCFTMLLGTTFAWFTDSAASGSNVITAGNLDIEVQYTLDGTTWKDLDGATDLFQKGLWEPGHTEVVALKITNAGSLALKYNANMNIVDETVGKTKDGADIKLSDILTVSTLTQAAADENGVNQAGEIALMLAFAGENAGGLKYETTTNFNSAILGTDKMLLPGHSYYVIVKVDMAETVGNEANHNGKDIPTINFGINVLATQYTYENDSFGKDYDEDAQYGEVPNVPTAEEKFLAALEKGGTVDLTSNITLTQPTTLITKDVTLNLNGYKITSARDHDGGTGTQATAATLTVDGATVTINGKGTIENTSTSDEASNYAITIINEGKLTVNDGTYIADDSAIYVNHGEVVINGGFFEAHRAVSPDYDYFPTYAGQTYPCYNAAVVNCTKGSYRAYKQGLQDQYAWANVDVTGGTFVNEDPSMIAEGDNFAESHVLEGYKVVKEVQANGDAWYTVVAE